MSRKTEHGGATYLTAIDGAKLEAGETKTSALYNLRPLVAGVRVIAHISTALPGIATTGLITENYYSTQK